MDDGGRRQMRTERITCIWPKQKNKYVDEFPHLSISGLFEYRSPYLKYRNMKVFVSLRQAISANIRSSSSGPFPQSVCNQSAPHSLFSHTLHIAPAPAWEPTLPQLSHRQGLNFRIWPNLCRRLDGVTARYQGQWIPMSLCISLMCNRVKLHLQNT